ncbi:serine racemase-like [Clytia hemisphaerica]|uniref:Tryptophan synthase beta chain-like PALP domain-containing protein n=1 Tax=Clytia hemisphaerica TaxID=252671 RepID=A0A7M5V7H9_9CNID|eukprot:TCONS_00059806-protein
MVIESQKISSTMGSMKKNQCSSIMERHQNDEVTFEGILEAAERTKDIIHNTPTMTCSYFDHLIGDDKKLFFKCEIFQKTGAFKIRGSANAVRRIIEERGKKFKVVTHSCGNGAFGLAYSAMVNGIPSTVVIPNNQSKKESAQGYKAKVIQCEESPKMRKEMVRRVISEDPINTEYIPTSDHPFCIEGVGSIGLEMLAQNPELDAILVACCFGSLISGIAKACKSVKPDIKIFAVEPERANDIAMSFEKGERVELTETPDTICDALKYSVGVQTWPIINEYVEPDVLLVSEEEIKKAMFMIFQRMKLVVEPSAAVVLAAALSDQFRGLSKGLKNIGLVLCGGNADLENLPW